MQYQDYTQSYAPNDPTWLEAFKIADKVLQFAGNEEQLVRAGWRGQLDTAQIIKTLGFTKFNIAALFDAATELKDLEHNAKTLEQVLVFHGARYAVTVLAINYTCDRILSYKLGPLGLALVADMMTNVEIGSRFGAKVPAVGMEGGTLMGFIRGAGLGILMASNDKEFKKWYRLTDGVESKALALKIFGCEPYQVSSAAVQLLGFGPEMAVGVALGMGRLSADHLVVSPEVLSWKACYLWLEALREGRSFPGPVDIRSFFREVAPLSNGKSKNGVLEVLYTEIATLKRHGSKANWHLTGIELPEPPPGFQRR